MRERTAWCGYVAHSAPSFNVPDITASVVLDVSKMIQVFRAEGRKRSSLSSSVVHPYPSFATRRRLRSNAKLSIFSYTMNYSVPLLTPTSASVTSTQPAPALASVYVTQGVPDAASDPALGPRVDTWNLTLSKSSGFMPSTATVPVPIRMVLEKAVRATTISIADIDADIASLQNLISHFPRPHSEHITSIHGLAMARFVRYALSRQKEDLDRSILHYTEAILLPPISQAGLSLNVGQFLFYLAMALLFRSKDFDQTEDVEYSIKYLRYLHRLPLEFFDIPRNIIIAMLIRALGTQVESGTGDGTWNIREMVILCRELLTSNVSADLPVPSFTDLAKAVEAEIDRGRPLQLLDQVIECLRDAVKMCPPGSHPVLFALARTLCTRFIIAHSNDDYEEATTILETILDPNLPGKFPDSIQALASSFVTMLAYRRSSISKNPEDTEMTISRLRAELSLSSIDEGLRLNVTNSLSILARRRFRDYGLAESREEANSYLSQVVDLLSSQNLAKSEEYVAESGAVLETYSTAVIQQKIQHVKGLISNTAPGTEHHKRLLRGLVDQYRIKFSRTNDISDIEESIKYGWLWLDLTHVNEPWRINPLPSRSLSEVLLLAFRHTNKTDYLNESIILDYDILKLKSARAEHFHTILRLVPSLLTRSQLLGRREDPHEAVRLMSLAVDNQYANEPDRFRLSCNWALIARRIRHSSVPTAYKTSISLMQRSLSFAPTVSIQHARLVEMSDQCQSMPLDYASYQIDLGRFEEAVETLEQGRALLWSEMRGLRTPIAQFVEEDSPLAKRFSGINQELEAMTVSITPSGRPEMEDGIAQGGDWMDPFGRLVVKRQKLMEERDALVTQIQGQPESEGFLKAPSFTTLRSAASRGPVILINHCRWRSDILIVFHNSLPCAIPTANDFYIRANKLQNELVEARKHGLDSGKYQDALSSVLKGLYKLVGEPVIKRFRLLGVPEQSRIWWCPTSVFCSLPLHAMGPISSSDTPDRYFSDLYISSYTPSLFALIESRKASTQTLDKPLLLLIAQPDDSLPGVKGEIKVIGKLEERVTVTSLVSSEATLSSVVDGLRCSRLAHFACHGVLEAGKPFEASFKLHEGSRLTLLDIVRSRLPDAEFAFLSCCHAAEITEESIADEGIHLTAAMQYCGFRSVVGTMWEMADTDGRDLAKSFYKSLFSSERPGVPYYERTAEALRDATRKLREKRGISLERWVNFVHYGA
ncbi:CHAT domain-containing protein [Lactarius akahatsu]|uniref:CHAT domain-containing protein n=1 Tax=Lactarius akahatsu TaxID=416441 RepID=A0AAD4Q2M0_9AGAM|nr:CHAT domain-containing protein [Lactarius akahatsu]